MNSKAIIEVKFSHCHNGNVLIFKNATNDIYYKLESGQFWIIKDSKKTNFYLDNNDFMVVVVGQGGAVNAIISWF